GVYSAPLIFALRKYPEKFKPYLDKKDQMTNDDTQIVHQLVLDLGGLAAAQALAEKYTTKALKELTKLPETPEKTIIIQLTRSLLTRYD
ncbi:MAG: polyprenyl synthetase family protein, partial [Carnobacterium sp.]